MRLEDCTSADVNRLLPVVQQTALEMQQLQIVRFGHLDPRDQIIASNVLLDLLQRAADNAAKQSTGGSRFIRSVRASMTVARRFSSSLLRKGPPGEEHPDY